MPKVLRIINRFNLGGITYNVSYLGRYMSPEFETLLIGGPEEKDEENSLFIPRSLGLEPLIIPEMKRSIHPLQDFLAYLRIKKLIREFKPDVVHTHASKAGLIGRLAAKHCGVPVIVHTFHGHVFQGYFPAVVNLFIRMIERYLASLSNCIVTISPEQKRQICEVHKICKPEKTEVVPLGFDLLRFTEQQDEKRKHFREKFFLKEEEIAVVIIGRLAPVKNHKLFIDAIKYSSERFKKPFRAFIVGDGKTRVELENYLTSLGLNFSSDAASKALFTFTGWFKEADLVLAGADIVCLSSKNEGTPVSLIEAQAAGKFCVSTDVGGVKDILNADCGYLAAVNEEQKYKELLLKALLEFEQNKLKASSGSKIVLEKFNYTRLCDDMSRLYKSLLKKTPV